MQRNDESALLDIEAACRFVINAVQGLDSAAFMQDPFRESAVLHHLTIAGEATKRLSQEFRDAHPSINWRAVAGLRDVIVHRYDRIDSDEVWTISTTSVPNLLAYIEPLLPEPPS